MIRRLCQTNRHCASLHFIVIKQPVHPHLRTMQRTTHERSIDLYFSFLPRTPRLRCSSQLRPTRIVLHLHNHRESSLYFFFSPKISPNLFEASLYLFPSLSGRLVCSAYTQLCIPALKATSSQMPVLAGDYLSNAL